MSPASADASLPPLALDIDGTLTGPDRVLDPRALVAIGEWPAPVVLATGKALPYPVALCEYAGLRTVVVAENGGVVCVAADERGDDDETAVAADGGTLAFEGNREAAEAVAETYVAAGHDLGWGVLDLVNRWRETEIAVSRASPLEPLERIAADHGLSVVDTGYAYHVKSPDVDKGRGLERAADVLECDPESFVAVGDSANDVATFGVAGRSFAVANADRTARAAADRVTEDSYGDGLLEALDAVRER